MFRKIFHAVAILNFAVLAIGSIILGGDAFNGKQVDGHFFLGSHGKYTEVSQAVFSYSKVQVVSVFIMFAIIMIMALIDKETKSRPPR